MNMADPPSIRLVLPVSASSVIEVNLDSNLAPRKIAGHGQISDAPGRGNFGSCRDPDGIDLRSPFSQCRAVFRMSVDPFELLPADEFQRHTDLGFGCRHGKPVAVSRPPVPYPSVILLSFDPDIRAVCRIVYPKWFDIRI